LNYFNACEPLRGWTIRLVLVVYDGDKSKFFIIVNWGKQMSFSKR
jgi:hypothetical protein